MRVRAVGPRWADFDRAAVVLRAAVSDAVTAQEASVPGLAADLPREK
ncbi:hypothetical protein NKG05_05120 [Oerskovia sp. M15]